MRKPAFLLSTILVFVIVSQLFVACDRENDSKEKVIEVENVINIFDSNKLYDVATVKAFAVYSSEIKMHEISKCKYNNNGFKLTLPNSVSDNYLSIYSQVPNGVTISNDKVNQCSVMLAACDVDGKQIGNFFWFSSDYFNDSADKPVYTANHYYFDRNLTVKGNYIEGEFNMKYDCSFKKGWNVLFIKLEKKNGLPVVSLITTKPPDVIFQWNYLEGALLYPTNNIAVVNIYKQIIPILEFILESN
ncbi:MAG: hypothetical protein LBI45_08165 [Bacteroidales bacterium]|jgi:hypothetical protein|nr:hypothetical protein [Bacteroidales bacterium]